LAYYHRYTASSRGESEPHAGLGEEVAGNGGVRLDLAAEVADVDAQGLGVLGIGVLRPPDLLEDEFGGDDGVGVLSEIGEDVELDPGEFDLLVAAADAALGEVNPKVAGGEGNLAG